MFNQIVYICKLMKNAWKISGTAFFEVIWVDGNQGGPASFDIQLPDVHT